MTRRFWGLAAVVAVGTLGSGLAQAAALTQEDFHLATTGNLVALCSAPETDPLYTAARNFCHGFTVGTYRAVATEVAASRSKSKLFCMTGASVTRDEAVNTFVQWASGRPKTLESAPTDGIIEYLAAKFPCK